MSEQITDVTRIPSFVRRKGRLSQAQERALQTLLPLYGLPLEEPIAPEILAHSPLILEIGFWQWR